MIKEIKGFVVLFLSHDFNNSLPSPTFPTVLKYVLLYIYKYVYTYIYAFKKDHKTEKENYWPIGILPTLSEVYEKLLYNQMY